MFAIIIVDQIKEYNFKVYSVLVNFNNNASK